jgi:hypothetical protein
VRIHPGLILALFLGCRSEEPPPSPAPPASSARAGEEPAAGAQPTAARGADDIEIDPTSAVDDEPPPDDAEAVAACAPPDPALKPMQLLRFHFTSGIEGKDAKDALAAARPGQRVYAHFSMRNRSKRDRCMHVAFLVGGKERTKVTLQIGESWQWRTWAYNTLRGDDAGVLRVLVTDDQGATIVDRRIGIVPP